MGLAERQTHEIEGRLFVRSGTMTCPHPSLCDRAEDESYEDYVRRHAKDHNLGEFDALEVAEWNLGVWCLYYQARHVIGNESLGTGSRIVAHWEPCWEDAEYIANWRFALSDTEQDTPWESRTFVLKPYAERDHAGAVYKRFKKLTKVRDTQKTSWGKAYITFRQLHARFVEDRPNFRVLVISGTSTLARDHYLQPLAEMWEHHENLRRLYGSMAYTQRHSVLLAQGASEEKLEAETRPLGLLARGSKIKDALRMRWLIAQKASSGLSAISLKVAGMTTTTTGNRWDLVVVDDPVTPENVLTEQSRKKVKAKIADLRKQGDADSEFLYLNTPYNIDDASSQIDNEQSDQYHILYRPAMWFETSTGAPCYYWQYNAVAPGKPVPGKPPRNAVWPPERIDTERDLPGFHSQVLLRARDESKLDYTEKDFPVVSINDRVPLEITAGLGKPITQAERDQLKEMGAEIRSYLLVDPSGNDEQTNRGDETWMTAMRLDRWGNGWIVRMAAGQFNSSAEENALYEAWVYSGADTINYEVSSSGKKWVKRGYAEFQAKKSQELKRAVVMPIFFREASSTKSKYTRMDQMHPFIKAGRLKILDNAAPAPLIAKFKRQWIDRGSEAHDDGPDSASMIQYYINVTEQYEAQNEPTLEGQIELTDTGLVFPAELLLQMMKGGAGNEDRPWGERG